MYEESALINLRDLRAFIPPINAVSKYLANLNCAEACRNVNSSHINTATLQTLRGPGQAAHDPLQFVSTSAVSLAENARKLISITEQQKRERAKLARNGPPFDDNESWQEDLDTWRRKRKTKVGRQECGDDSSLSRDYSKEYHSLPNYGRSHKRKFDSEGRLHGDFFEAQDRICVCCDDHLPTCAARSSGQL
ncbi:hypothetical protein KIN20_004628 [Parelaphostrongylus tenuis]|uniref:DUF4757 domain-containing protein n=1 Tax=Parelaphostrongylus tenuis TaxID=148309 RepID=A0AAD5MHJ6_PARTN|nr:hypothetical protein KIN20_004628 [Parelaphostrongylus tenuis]